VGGGGGGGPPAAQAKIHPGPSASRRPSTLRHHWVQPACKAPSAPPSRRPYQRSGDGGDPDSVGTGRALPCLTLFDAQIRHCLVDRIRGLTGPPDPRAAPVPGPGRRRVFFNITPPGRPLIFPTLYSNGLAPLPSRGSCEASIPGIWWRMQLSCVVDRIPCPAPEGGHPFEDCVGRKTRTRGTCCCVGVGAGAVVQGPVAGAGLLFITVKCDVFTLAVAETPVPACSANLPGSEVCGRT
jgi:hypothetical protein